MSSTATTTTTTTIAKSKDRSSSSSASQKFWPLKKFNLHNNSHGKAAAAEEEQSIALVSQTETTTVVVSKDESVKDSFSPSSATAIAANEKDAQKKSKNKRLSSLLSTNRRQEGTAQASASPPEAATVEPTPKKQQSNTNASNTPTLTRKTGRDIGNKARAAAATSATLQSNTAASAAKQQQLTAKPAGSGTLGRSTAKSSPRATTTKESKFGSVRRQSEDKSAKRSQSPSTATKANDAPPQPTIMLSSVQQKIQQEQEAATTSIKGDYTKTCATKKEENEIKCSKKDRTSVAAANVNTTLPARDGINDDDLNDDNTEETKDQLLNNHDESNDFKGKHLKETRKEKEKINPSCIDDLTNKQVLPLPSPPVTPAALATSLPEYSSMTNSPASSSIESIANNNKGMNMISVHSEPGSPTMCTFNILQPPFMQHQPNNNNSLIEIDKMQQQQQLNSLFVQQQQHAQPIPRSIHRLRSAASFATLRHLASTNNSLQNQQQQQQQLYTIPQQQQQHIQQIKRRPVSFIEPSSHSNINYSTYASSFASDDYLTINRPVYNRRASSEDSSHFHIRQQSDNINGVVTHQHSNSNTIDSRRLVRSNTVHNLIIKDGQGHRIVQCVGSLDQSPPLQPLLKKNTSSFENSNEFHHHDWSPPPEILDDMLYASRQQQQQIEEQQYHQQQYLLIQQQQQTYIAAAAAAQQQQQQQQQDNKTDTASDTSGSSGGSSRRISRKDSAKSISSLCSSSPPVIEKLKDTLEKERAIVKALQKQKEACNKDIVFLNKSLDDLTNENQELKKKFDNEKTLKERFQDDLSSALDKLNEATEHIRQLENQNKSLKAEIDDKNIEIRELEKKKQTTTIKKFINTTDGGKSDRVLVAQLQHSQNQVRLLKSTMEQFLRMGVFTDDLNPSNSSCTSPTTSIEAIFPDFKCNKSRQQQQRSSNNPGKSSKSSAVITVAVEDTATNNNITAVSPTLATPPFATIRSKKSLLPTEKENKATKTPEKIKHQDELDAELFELQREKEILQAEYSKAPSSGGNALIRRRREELESRLDTVDSQMCRIKLKLRSRNIF